MRQSRTWQIRNPADVPFFCSPVHLFFVEWALMLATFFLHISYTSFPDFSVAFSLLLLASAGFLAGYATLRLATQSQGVRLPFRSRCYRVNMPRMRYLHLAAVLFVLAITLANLKLYGLPPIFAVFGVDTLSYQDYGSLRQPLFATIMLLFVSAPLEESAWRRWGLYLFSPACMLLYSSRGYLLVMLFQALAVFSLRTSLNKRKVYFISATTLCIAVLVSNFIGNSRSSLGADAMIGYLQIKRAYHHWPAAYLWVISYVSTPFSNMCWIVRVYPYRHPTFHFLYSALPGAWSQSLEGADLGSEKIIDGVHTYMAKYFIDFWYFGILGINYVWGLIAAFITTGDRLTRNFFSSAVLLGCMAFMFFSDFLTILIIILELLALVLVQRYMTVPVDEPSAAMAPAIAQAIQSAVL